MAQNEGPFQRGERLTAVKLNEMTAGKPLSVSGRGVINRSAGHDELELSTPEVIYMRLTEKDATKTPVRYGWVEVDRLGNPNATISATWGNITTRTANATDDFAIEPNNGTLSTTDNAIHRAERSLTTGEWVITSGGGGGTNTKTQSNPIIMLLGPWADYKDCPGVPAKPPTFTANGTDFCAPPYAWAAYDVCNYKYVKKFDMRDFGHWATELNGGSATAFRRLYNAYYGNSTESANLTLNSNTPTNCKGVRFLGFSSQGSLVCTCPTWLSQVKCLKFTAKFVATLTDNPDDTCPAQFYTDMAPYWGTTQTVTACQQSPGACTWAADIGPFSLTLIWQEIPINGGCNWGPDVFDPCNPCDGFGQLKLTMGKGSGSGGTAANWYSGYSMTQQAIHGLILDCTTGPITVPFSIKYSACPQVFESLTVQCCSAGESTACE
jgi:hypothetical protein